jgi:GT2 family glycosyltransferase
LAISEGAEYVYLLNHDAYLVESVVDILKDKFIHNPQFGILTPLQVKESRKELEINFARYLTFDGIILRILNDTILEDNKKEIYEVSFAQAASWLIKKEVIEKVGVFNPLFFHYGEDNEYLNRLKFHQFKIGVVTDSKVVHIANPLNLSHKKNFDRYHRNREFNRWLVKQLDINTEFTFGSWLKSLIPYIRMSIKSFFQLEFLKFLRLFKLLVRIIKISSCIKNSRIINS